MHLRLNSLLVATLISFLLLACAKDSITVGEGEPIAINEPIQNPSQSSAGKEINYALSIVTDRNIDSVTVHYHLDSTKSGYNNGDPINYIMAHKTTVAANLAKFSGKFTMPTNVKYGDVVRVIYQLRAKDRYAQKILRVDVK